MPLSYTQLGNALVPETLSILGAPRNELALALPSPINTRFVASALAEAGATRIKVLAIVIDTALTSSAPQQATVQLFAARSIYATLGPPATPFAGAQGAASQFPTTGENACKAVGIPVNLGGSVSTLGGGGGVFWFSPTYPGDPNASPPTSMVELMEPYSCLGIEITAPAAFTGGVIRAFLQLSPL